MIPVEMISAHSPKDGSYGDCYRACMASILELPAEKVPHFVWDDPTNEEFYKRVDLFLMPMGMIRLAIPYTVDPRLTMSLVNPGVYYIYSGETRSGTGHSVVCRGDKIVHDPSPLPLDIVGPLRDEDEDQESYYWVELLGSSVALHKSVD